MYFCFAASFLEVLSFTCIMVFHCNRKIWRHQICMYIEQVFWRFFFLTMISFQIWLVFEMIKITTFEFKQRLEYRQIRILKVMRYQFMQKPCYVKNWAWICNFILQFALEIYQNCQNVYQALSCASKNQSFCSLIKHLHSQVVLLLLYNIIQ